jgi:hypothetical protein
MAGMQARHRARNLIDGSKFKGGRTETPEVPDIVKGIETS